ncbi:uncharacterized protein FOMMEDRAFT_135426 [Fomitiporia mediterranea MF3/22]|uniref:uncharacterized protein n=1 Tax=Fomitiporia mediterranea (strain MF3/22) TaxID=694068 RepID=UPI0004408ED1|nr:uncharacterized protein FOMMEDRAFT_135426 [Fomitiporia mediterranea MF3/22]EJD01175.1 hypothetical protein FOMMEDRAFT_135426 [Fomitiporia mediterranea MF3/22]
MLRQHEMRHLMLGIIGLACLTRLSVPVSASGTYSQHVALPEHQKRQMVAPQLTVPLPTMTTSSPSFDYWWPFPLAPTSAADNTDTADVQSPTDTSLLTSGTPLASNFVASSVSASLLPGVSLDASSSYAGADSTSSLITITALPPLSSPFHGHRASYSYHKPINSTLLAPLFGLLSAALGIACGWFAYGYWKRRRNARIEDRLAGPRYEGVKGEDEGEKTLNDTVTYANNDFSGTVAEGDMSMGPHLRGQDYDCSSKYEDTETRELLMAPTTFKSTNLPGRFSAILRSPILSSFVTRSPKSIPESGANIKDRVTRQPANISILPSEKDTSYAGGTQSPSARTAFSSVAKSGEDNEDDGNIRRLASRLGPVQHKSIHRRLVEKLRMKFSTKRTPGREKSKTKGKARGKTPELEEGALLQGENDSVDISTSSVKGSLRQKPSGLATRHGRADSDFSIVSLGVQTPPKVYTLSDPGVSNVSPGNILQGARAYSTPLKSDTGSNADKYTPVPNRRVRSTRKLVSPRSLRRRSSILDDSGGPSKYDGNSDRRVLPTSPPLLNLPNLESDLFFSPVREFARNCPDMSQHGYFTPPRCGQDGEVGDSPVRRGPSGPRQPNKLISLQSPSNGMASRPAQPQFTDKPVPALAIRRSTAFSPSCLPSRIRHGPRDAVQDPDRTNSTPSGPSSLMPPKERYETRCTAFDKVDAIVEQSWGARFLQGIPPPPSPTLFGARTDQVGADFDTIAGNR